MRDNNARVPRVYVTNDTGQDMSKAQEYGELVKLTSGSVDPFRPHIAQKTIEDGLREFDASVDYILPAGALLATAFTFAWLALHAEDPNHNGEEDRVSIKMLIFDSKKREYMCRTVAI